MRFNFQITCFVFSIVSFWSSQMMESKKLPRSPDEVQAIFNCLVKVIGYDIIPELFRTEIGVGEYMEEFCKDIRVANVQEAMKKYIQKDKKIGEEIKNCLHDSENDDIYNDYYNYGNIEFNRDENMILDTATHSSTKDDHPQTLQFLPSKDRELAISEDEANENDILNLSKFVLGACFNDKPMDFDELEDGGEKENTIVCLEDCVSRFIVRSVKVLNDARDKIIKDLTQKGITEQKYKAGEIEADKFPSEMKYIEDESKLIVPKHSFGQAFYSSPSQDLETMNSVGKISLNHHSQVYSNINEYQPKTEKNNELSMAEKMGEKTSTDDKKDKDLPLNTLNTINAINNKLSGSFKYCKYCAKRECFMKKSSLPLYAYVYSVATGKDQTTLPATTEYKTKIAETSVSDDIFSDEEKKIEPQRNFFEVLISEDKFENDADDDKK